MNYIYKYKNKKNGKVYIGQTNNIERRIREHRSIAFNPNSANYKDYFHQALRKHGESAFDFEIIYQGECDQEELDKKETAFIRQYHSHVSENGYNLTLGGQGYKKTSAYIENAEDIKQDLEQGISYKVLMKKYDCCASFLSNVNHGLVFYESNRQYPINSYGYLNADDIYPQMVSLLQDPRFRFSDIANELNVSIATVKAFNNGRLRNGQYWKQEYPIRDKYFANKPNWFQALDLLLNTNIPMRKIGREMCYVGDVVMEKINRGELIPQENINYPIRK